VGVLTEFCSIPSKPEPRQHHLSQSKRRSKARKPTDSHDTQKIEEKIDEEGIDEAKSVKRLSEDTDSEGTNDHVGRKPLCLVSSCERTL